MRCFEEKIGVTSPWDQSPQVVCINKLTSIKVEDRGLEPLKEIDAKPTDAMGCDSRDGPGAANALHDLGPDCLRLALTDPALRKVIAAWNSLPPHIRQAILLLIGPGQDSPV